MGRSPDCDIVLTEPEISRHHALIYLEAGAPKLVVLGTGHVSVAGHDVQEPRDLCADDRIQVGSLELTVVTGDEAGAAPRFLLQLIRGGAYPVQGPRFSIGGGDDDGLHLATLPPAAIVLEPHEGFVSVETSAPGIRVGGREQPPGDVGSLRDGSTLKFGDTTLRVVAVDGSALAQTRQAFDIPDGPVEVSLHRLPRGGRLRLWFDDRDGEVYLAERRYALLVVLLRPPGAPPGAFIDDATVMQHVWPGEARNRTHLNTLIHRTRKDLISAGLDGPALIERAEGGGATRFAVSELCQVNVESPPT